MRFKALFLSHFPPPFNTKAKSARFAGAFQVSSIRFQVTPAVQTHLKPETGPPEDPARHANSFDTLNAPQ